MTIADAQDALAQLQAAPSALSLPLDPDLPYDRWATMGRALGLMDRAGRWWIGDWLNYGEQRYGERHAQALDDTGLAYGTLRNIAWVARRFPPSRRRDTPAWYMHAEGASLPPEQQDVWLDAAEAGHWTRQQLRESVQQARVATVEPALLPPLPGAEPVSLDGSPIADPWPVRAVADGLLREGLVPQPQRAHGPQTRAWCRCPDGADVGQWTLTLAERWRAGELAEAVALVPCQTDSGWWQELAPAALCLVRGWLDGQPGPWALAYLGPRPAAFAAAFGGIGQVWLPWTEEGA
jgi:hypothetical protein